MKSKLFCCILCIFYLNIAAIYSQPNMDSAVIKTIKIKDHIHMLQWAGAGNAEAEDDRNATK